MTSTILEVQHAFDAAHRLPELPGKCQSLHGHTWRVTVRVSGPLGSNGLVADMGKIKGHLRAFVDDELDHGTMLGEEDPLVSTLRDQGGKVFVFDAGHGGWPTVENVAGLVGRHLHGQVADLGLEVVDVRVAETDSNAAVWSPW